MATFTKIEELFDQFPQSVGGNPTEGGNGNEAVRIFQPDRGLDVLIYNTDYIDRALDDHTTGISASFDDRQSLGTITLNNRDFWENSNYNKNSFQPFLRKGKETVRNQVIITDGNGDEIIFNEDRKYSTFKFSIDAIPFVINPNTDEIVRLDRYYDKNIDSEKYDLTTEGKINYYILPRGEGRTEKGNIDTLGYKALKTKSGKNRFDAYASTGNKERGYHLFRLDWGDGTPLEHTTKTKLLEGTTLLEHSYQKPGFYTIKGVVMAYDGFRIGSWEKFETTISINSSANYDVNLYNYENFATIGGISNDSVLVKSATDIVGINPLTFNTERALPEAIENINLFDRLNLFNFLTKIDWPILNNFYSDFIDYTKEIYDTTEPIMDVRIFGCMDPNADNFNATANISTECNYSYNLTWSISSEESSTLNYTAYYVEGGLSRSTNYPEGYENTLSEGQPSGFFWEDAIQNNGQIGVSELQSSEFANIGVNGEPSLFFKFIVGTEPPEGLVGISNANPINKFTLTPLTVFDGTGIQGGGVPVFGWYALIPTSSPSVTNYQDREIFFEQTSGTQTGPENTGDYVSLINLNANIGDNWYTLNEDGTPNFSEEYIGSYHQHISGLYHIGDALVGDSEEIDNWEGASDVARIVNAIPPVDRYKVKIYNSPYTPGKTIYSKIRFPGEGDAEYFFQYNTAIDGMYQGQPGSYQWQTNDSGMSNAQKTNQSIANYVTDNPVTLPYVAGSNLHIQSFNVQEGNVGIQVTAQADTISGTYNEDLGVWDGWYRDADFTNLITMDKTVTITLGDISTYGGVDAITSGDYEEIELYAKVKVTLEM